MYTEFARKPCDKLQNIALNVITSKLYHENFQPFSTLPVLLWRQVWQAVWPGLTDIHSCNEKQSNVTVRNVFRLFGCSSSVNWLDLSGFIDQSLEVNFVYENVLTLNLHKTKLTGPGYSTICARLTNVRELNLSSCSNVDDNCLLQIAKSCLNIAALNIAKTSITASGIVKAIDETALTNVGASGNTGTADNTGATGNTGAFLNLISLKHGTDSAVPAEIESDHEGEVEEEVWDARNSLAVRVVLKNCPNLKYLAMMDLMVTLIDIWEEVKDDLDRGLPCDQMKLTRTYPFYFPVHMIDGFIRTPMKFHNQLSLLCPNLEDLEVDLYSIARDDERLAPVKPLLNLKHLHCVSFLGFRADTPRAMEFVVVYGNTLTELTCSVPGLHIPTLLDLCPNLKRLTVCSENAGCFEQPNNQKLMKTYPGLVFFCHNAFHPVVDDDEDRVPYESFGDNPFKMMPNLTELKLLHLPFSNADEYLTKMLVEEGTLMSLDCLVLDGRVGGPTEHLLLYLVQNLDRLPCLKFIQYLVSPGWPGSTGDVIPEEKARVLSQARMFVQTNNINCRIVIN